MFVCFLFNLIEITTPAPVQPGGGAELRVVVNPEVLQVQRGRTVEITCIVYGGDSSTNIYWIQEEPERVKYFKIFLSKIKLFLKFFLALRSNRSSF
jgi:hypothetical protein